MTKNLRTALITGGARRIGRAIASDLSAAGFAVAIHYHGSDKEARELVKILKDGGGKVAIVRADLTDMDAVERLLGDAASALGPVGLLVNNASIFNPDELDDFTWEHWDRHFAIHLKAPVELSRRFAEALPFGILTGDPRGYVVFCNDAAQQIQDEADQLRGPDLERLGAGASLLFLHGTMTLAHTGFRRMPSPLPACA